MISQIHQGWREYTSDILLKLDKKCVFAKGESKTVDISVKGQNEPGLTLLLKQEWGESSGDIITQIPQA